MSVIAANELKTRGISAIEPELEAGEHVVISVRGKRRYVVMSLDTYDRLRELELEGAIREARADYEAGRVVVESVDDHMRRMTGEANE